MKNGLIKERELELQAKQREIEGKDIEKLDKMRDLEGRN